jgi:hypothetical protein
MSADAVSAESFQAGAAVELAVREQLRMHQIAQR